MDATVAALIGAAVGAVGGVVGQVTAAWIQQSAQTKRDIVGQAAQLGLEDFKTQLALAEKRGGQLYPMSIYVYYHAEFLRALSSGQFDADEIRRIEGDLEKLQAALPRRFKQGP